MSDLDKHTKYYKIAKSMILIIYGHVTNLRQENIIGLISDELIECEELLIKYMGIYYFYQNKANYKKKQESYLNIINIIKILNSSNFVIQAVKDMTLESIVDGDMGEIEKIFETRTNDLDVEKFMKSLKIFRQTIDDLKGYAVDSQTSTEIHLPNDYKYRKKNNVIPKSGITRKLTPHVLDCNEEISKLRIQPTSSDEQSTNDYLSPDIFVPHRFNKKQLAIFEACHKCNKFGWVLNVCRSCGMKVHDHCISSVTGGCSSSSTPSSGSPSKSKSYFFKGSSPVLKDTECDIGKIDLQEKGEKNDKPLTSKRNAKISNFNVSPITSNCKYNLSVRKKSEYTGGGSQPSAAKCENLNKRKKDQNSVNSDILKDSSIANSLIDPTKAVPANNKPPENSSSRGLEFSKLHKNETIMSDWLVPWKNVKVGLLIRTDRFGGTYAGDWHGYRTISIIKKGNVEEEELADFRSKIQTLRKTRHDNLIMFICASIGPSILAIISEYTSGESLYNRIYENPFMSEASIMSIIIQILNGLGYLHSRKIVHMNLNTKNIYYSSGIIKLCDFGLVSVYNQRKFIHLTNNPYPGFVIPKDWLNYQAPEILKYLSPSKHGLEVRRYNFKTDIFALGIVYFELIMGCTPWHDYSSEAFLYKVCNRVPFIINGSDLTAKHIIQKCLEDEEHRFQKVSEIEDIVYKMPRRVLITRTPSQPYPKKVAED